tara:strand:- start:5381 stop:5872 length:492 start_codon:yes stop_codon:yes gene_type:complete
MRNRKFAEEEVVEETTTETTEESTPDSHETFVNILVEMGLSAEQAEAVHSMAMDLIEAGEGEETTTEVNTETTEKVEASRLARRKRALRRSKGKRPERPNREARQLSRLRRQNIELRKQLREFGASPASKPLRNAPQQEEKQGTTQLTGVTSRAFEMIKNLQK